MDLLKARKKAKKAREEEKKKAEKEAAGGPEAPEDTAKERAEEAAPAGPAEPAEKSLSPERAEPWMPADEVFEDLSFGEGLPGPEHGEDGLSLGQDPGRPAAGPAEAERGNARPEEPAPGKGASPVEPSAPPEPEGEEKEKETAPSGKEPASRVEREEEGEDEWSLDGLFSEEDDFFALVTEDLYARVGREEDLSMVLELLSFRLGRETYAVRLTSIRQIIKPLAITMVPRTPDYVMGVVSIRGTVIPVFDLRKRLNLEQSDFTRKSRIVVVTHQGRVAGLAVDRVEQVVRIAENSVEPPPAMLAGVEGEYIEGIGRSGGRMIILLALDKILVPVEGRQEARAV